MHLDKTNWIQFNSIKIAFSELQKSENIYLMNAIESTAFTFAQQWLNGEEKFYQKSSGSTGQPKEISISRSQMEASANATLATLKLSNGDTALLSISPEYIGGKMMIVRALLGSLNLIVGEVSGNPLNNLPAEQQIDFFSFVPYQMDQILNQYQDGISLLNKSKAIILGGAPVSDSLANQIKEHIKAPVYSTYGMTETVSHIALKRINGVKEAPFQALENVYLEIDERDCLVIKAEAITGVSTLATNDIVRLYNEKEFDWLGRYDFVINSGGIKIHPEQVEKLVGEAFHQINSSNLFFVFGQAHKQLGTCLCIAIEGEMDKEVAQKALKNMLPPYQQPKEIYFISEFTYTGSGKINRQETLKKAGIQHV